MPRPGRRRGPGGGLRVGRKGKVVLALKIAPSSGEVTGLRIVSSDLGAAEQGFQPS